ncbi:anthranilate synthase component I [Alkalihalobacillus trypoxylicola]|nr:anthranilate synthase component I [Alkalihalobacillus trypoxylicola]
MMKTSYQNFCEAAKVYKTVPVVEQFFADGLTPIQIVHQLTDEVSFVLESNDDASIWSNYSFIGLHPLYHLVEEQNQFCTYEVTTNKKLIQQSTFEAAYEETMSFLNVQPLDLPLPFKGGAVGYMSYDAIETIEPSLKTVEESRNVPYYQFLVCQTLIAFNHVTKQLAVIVHTPIQSHQSVKSQFEASQKKIKELIEQLEQPNRGLSLKTTPIMDEEVSFEGVQSNYLKTDFLSHVEEIKEYIRAGDVFQTVLSQRFEMDVKSSGLEIYRVLRMVNPSPYLFYLKFNSLEIIGSSPERLVQVQDGEIEIHPIAGTRKRGKTFEEDQALAAELLQDEKERSEHYMLVDLARNDVGRVAKYGSVETPTLLEIGRFSHVMHIISKVTGILKEDYKPMHALMASFPAGTVSGAPKIRAMEILQELEPTKRGIYAGAIGYLGFDGNIDSCIAIRTLVLEKGKAYIQAGAGIVADSIAELEYEETQNKAKALIRAVQIAEKMFGYEEVK